MKLTHYDETKISAHDSQIVRAKENLKLSYDGSSQRQASGNNQQIKALRHIKSKRSYHKVIPDLQHARSEDFRIHANSEGSVKKALMRRLDRAYTARTHKKARR